MRWQRLRGLEVVETAGGQTLGRVDGLELDGERATVRALRVGDRAVPWERIGAGEHDRVGHDAVTVEHERALEPRDGTSLDPVGTTVLSDAGVRLGRLVDLELDDRTGEVRRLLLGDDDLAGDRLRGVGSYAVVVAASGDAAGASPGSSTTGGDPPTR
jgi:sporulation protein YlmC with PRC-barrel domain